MFTNLQRFGGHFEKILDEEFQQAKGVRICTGYVSVRTIEDFENRLTKVAENGGWAILLVGMAHWEGLKPVQIDALRRLNQKLKSIGQNSGVSVAWANRYHGKVFQFFHGDLQNIERSSIYVGSSNFSPTGLKTNIECMVPVQGLPQKRKLNEFLTELCSSRYARNINEVEIPNSKQPKTLKRGVEHKWEQLERYNPSSVDISALPRCEIPILNRGRNEKSGPNAYFGKGRWSRRSGKVKSRPWYEIEIIAGRGTWSLPAYPKGQFRAKTDDGFIIPMKTQGDHKKNLRSAGSLQLFGKWLKGKLEKAQSLQGYRPVDREVLKDYGADKLTLYKISKDEYFMRF